MAADLRLECIKSNPRNNPRDIVRTRNISGGNIANVSRRSDNYEAIFSIFNRHASVWIKSFSTFNISVC